MYEIVGLAGNECNALSNVINTIEAANELFDILVNSGDCDYVELWEIPGEFSTDPGECLRFWERTSE